MTLSRSLLFVLMSSGLLLCTASSVQTQATPDYKVQVVSPHDGLRVQTDNAGGQVGSFGGLGEFVVDAPFVVGGRLSVKENGRVGIGTPFPDQLLTVNSANAATNSRLSFQLRDVTAGYAGLGQDARLRLEALPGTELRLQSDGNTKPMTFYQNGSEQMRVDETGLSVAGTIQSTAGGFMFPDGSVQNSAASPTYTTTSLLGNGSLPLQTPGPPIVPLLRLLNLPAGTYMLSATVDLLHGAVDLGTVDADCVFSSENTTVHTFSLGPAAGITLRFHSVLNVTSGSVNVACYATNTNILTSSGRLTATQTGTVTVQ